MSDVNIQTTFLEIAGDYQVEVEEKLSKLAKKIGKTSVNLYEMVTEPFEKIVLNPKTGKRETKIWYRYAITVKIPEVKYNGFSYVGILKSEFTKSNSVDKTIGLVNTCYPADSKYDLSKYSNMQFRCDHCKTTRTRKQVHLFLNEKGEELMVAASCAKEYFGVDVHRRIMNIIEVGELLAKYPDMFQMYGCPYNPGHIIRDEQYDHELFCSLVYGMIKTKGYVKQSKEDVADYNVRNVKSTSMEVQRIYYSKFIRKDTDAILRKQCLDLASSLKYEDIEKYWLTTVKTEGNTFLTNVKNQFRMYFPQPGMLTWAVYNYMQNVEFYGRELEQTTIKNNEFFGEVGTKYTDTLKVASCKKCNGNFGPFNVVTFYNDKGYRFVYMGNDSFDANVSVKVSFKVKEHKQFKDDKQTIIHYIKTAKETV